MCKTFDVGDDVLYKETHMNKWANLGKSNMARAQKARGLVTDEVENNKGPIDALLRSSYSGFWI